MILGLNHITLSVSDLDRAFVFYTELVGLKPIARWYKGAHLLAGDIWVCLNLETAFAERTPGPTYDHFALTIAKEDFASLRERLLVTGVREWQDNHSEGYSFYFLDPDGHKLELHTTTLQDRLDSLRKAPPKELVFFS